MANWEADLIHFTLHIYLLLLISCLLWNLNENKFQLINVYYLNYKAEKLSQTNDNPIKMKMEHYGRNLE